MIGKLVSRWLTEKCSTLWKFIWRLLGSNQLQAYRSDKKYSLSLDYFLPLRGVVCGCLSRKILIHASVSKNRQQVTETFIKRMFPQCFPVVSVLLPRFKLCFRYTVENFKKKLSMQTVVKRLWARANEHSSNFCKQFNQRPCIFCEHWMGPFNTPFNLPLTSSASKAPKFPRRTWVSAKM